MNKKDEWWVFKEHRVKIVTYIVTEDGVTAEKESTFKVKLEPSVERIEEGE